jgi:hypothetical protein
MALHPRGLLPLLRARLDRWPITVLTGARQTGKTTLARDLLPRAEGPEAVYFSLDDPDEPLRLAADPVRRLDHGKRLVVLALAQNLFAARTAQLLSYSDVARELGVAVNTVRRYLRFLEISYQVSLLRPLLPTVTARLIKSPKLYWTDPGLARALGEPGLTAGALFETAVLAELLRWRSFKQDPPALHFYRTRAGRAVDFVLQDTTRLVALEAKASERAHPTDARAVADLLEARVRGAPGATNRLGLVVTRGRKIEPLAPGVWAIPDWRLFGPAE